MVAITVTATSRRQARAYIEALEWAGATARLYTPRAAHRVVEALKGSGGLMLTGGPDVHPGLYSEAPRPQAGLDLSQERDTLDMRALCHALERDMPVLAICRGMQLLNMAFGGKLIQDLPGHRGERKDGAWTPAQHSIYVSPGSKLAAIIGSGGFFRVNSIHHQGLREAHRSPRLLASAYSLEDGIIEGLESPEHHWVIGLQCHPERFKECPLTFRHLFKAFVERAEEHREQVPAKHN